MITLFVHWKKIVLYIKILHGKFKNYTFKVIRIHLLSKTYLPKILNLTPSDKDFRYGHRKI